MASAVLAGVLVEKGAREEPESKLGESREGLVWFEGEWVGEGFGWVEEIVAVEVVMTAAGLAMVLVVERGVQEEPEWEWVEEEAGAAG